MEELLESMFQQLKIIFWGNSSLLSLVEIIFRTSFMYVYTLLLVRIIGKRGVATLAPFEMAVIVVLGSVLADPMLNIKTPLVKGIEHLGEVKCSFLETNGRVSVWINDKNDIRPGLSIFPCLDSISKDNFSKGFSVSQSHHFSCQKCGNTIHLSKDEMFKQCGVCHHHSWEESSLVRVISR